MRLLGTLHIRRYLVTGLLLVLPLWLTYVLAKFVFTVLAGVTEPLVRGLLDWPEWALLVVSGLLTLVLVYLIGWLGSRVFGDRLLRLFHRLVERIPLVQTVYRAVRRLVEVLQSSPDRPQRVVMFEDPPGTMTIGLVTRMLSDTTTGGDYAAVYVPSTPNPAAGIVHLVPLADLHPSHMTVDEAMSFVASGGIVHPARFVEKPESAMAQPEPAAEQRGTL